jgi:hypothetical protein
MLDAMALGERLSAGAMGRELRDQSRAWLNKNFDLVAPSVSDKSLAFYGCRRWRLRHFRSRTI